MAFSEYSIVETIFGLPMGRHHISETSEQNYFYVNNNIENNISITIFQIY